MTRGILATIYVDLKDQTSEEALHQIYKQKYDDKPFVRVRDLGEFPTTKEVLGSNYCDIGIYVDEDRQKLLSLQL